jgi:hypothetical protein
MAIKLVKKYMTSDNKLFDSKLVAQAHEEELQLRTTLEKFFSRMNKSDAEKAVNYCIENIDELRNILTAKKRRRTKK